MDDSDARWICCQIGAREHYAVARALYRRNALELLVTDAWVTPSNPLGMIKPGLRGRFHRELAAANVYAPNRQSVAFELRTKLAGLQGWHQMIARNEWFQRRAVERLSRIGQSDAPRTLMAYSYAALEPFRLARARGWRTVLAQIDPGPPEERIVARLYEENPSFGGAFERAPARYWSAWREECALADRIVVNSPWSRSALVEEGMEQSKLCVIPLAYEAPPEAETFRRSYPPAFTPARPLRVLFLGQINLRKGIGPLLDAVRLLRGEPIEFWFVGPVQISIPQELRETPQARWIGAVPHHETARYYRDADLFVFPTFSDGFGLTQLEAQAWKLPALATKCCGEVVHHGSNGWLLPEITAPAIAAAVRQCLAQPSLLQEASARCGLGEGFGLDRVGQQWLQLFH
jgi:glycosyltransferase involved in cell wall biosynthesis